MEVIVCETPKAPVIDLLNFTFLWVGKFYLSEIKNINKTNKNTFTLWLLIRLAVEKFTF